MRALEAEGRNLERMRLFVYVINDDSIRLRYIKQDLHNVLIESQTRRK